MGEKYLQGGWVNDYWWDCLESLSSGPLAFALGSEHLFSHHGAQSFCLVGVEVAFFVLHLGRAVVRVSSSIAALGVGSSSTGVVFFSSTINWSPGVVVVLILISPVSTGRTIAVVTTGVAVDADARV